METEPKPKVLRLRGEEIRCIDALPPGLLFDLAEMQDTTNTMGTMARIGRFLREVVRDDEQERFRAIIYDKVDVLGIEALSEAAGDLIREYADRPLEQPSQSPPGSDSTAPLSRVVSFSRGTVETEPTSSPVGPSPES